MNWYKMNVIEIMIKVFIFFVYTMQYLILSNSMILKDIRVNSVILQITLRLHQQIHITEIIEMICRLKKRELCIKWIKQIPFYQKYHIYDISNCGDIGQNLALQHIYIYKEKSKDIQNTYRFILLFLLYFYYSQINSIKSGGNTKGKLQIKQ